MNCGCGCEPTGPTTPEPVFNAPGLDRLQNRVARHSSVKAAILRGLADADLPALAGLTAREDTDLTVALADGFAALADVVTFYNERIANECYLRTATERLSVVELSRMIGYRPGPGVAADAWLAFTVDEVKTLPRQPAEPVRVPAGTQVQSVPGQDEQPVTFETVAPITARASWNAIAPIRWRGPGNLKGRTDLYLAGTGHRLVTDDVIVVGKADSLASDDWEHRVLVGVEEDQRRGVTHLSWEQVLTKDIPGDQAGVSVLRLRAAIFGHNAPDPRLLSDPRLIESTGTKLVDLVTPEFKAWKGFSLTRDKIDLDQPYRGVVKGGWVLIVDGTNKHLANVKDVQFPSVSAFGVAGKTTRIELSPPLPTDPQHPDDPPLSADARRTSVVLAQSEPLALSPYADTSAVAGSSIDLDAGVALEPGRALAVFGPEHGSAEGAPVHSEVVLVADRADAVTIASGTTRVRLARALTRAYDRFATTVSANVAPATEGASVSELLGNGEATQPGQAFALRQRPLTWMAADSGSEPTLKVHVDEVAWHRRATLYGARPDDRVYTIEIHDDGSTVVRFGDGAEGARLPTGQANVRARYRIGVGSDGNVRTGQLSTLLPGRWVSARSATPPPAPAARMPNSSIGPDQRAGHRSDARPGGVAVGRRGLRPRVPRRIQGRRGVGAQWRRPRHRADVMGPAVRRLDASVPTTGGCSSRCARRGPAAFPSAAQLQPVTLSLRCGYCPP